MRSPLPLALALACLLAAPSAWGQVRQSGTVSPGHAAQWTTSGVIQDAGTSLSGNLTTLGITANGGTPFCLNSGPITAAYEQLCLGISSAGAGTLSLGSFGGAPSPTLSIAINGVTSPLISGLVAGTGISISGSSTPTISLSTIGNNTMLANNAGATQPPTATSLTSFLDSSFGSNTGNIIFRAAGGWQVLAPGSNGNCLTYTSGGTPIAWGSCAGSGGTGTVTSITAGTGLTGGTITTSGTIGLSSPVAASNGGTGVAAVGSANNALVSTGSAWASSAIVNSLADAANGGLAFSSATGALTANISPADATLKATPAGTDTVLIGDSAASFALKKVTVSSLASSPGNFHKQIFYGHLASGTFTPAAGVTAVQVIAGGAGGGGGGGDLSSAPGSNGTSGFQVTAYAVAVTPGVGVTVTIATGGGGGTGNVTSSTAGATGGDTSFGGLVVAKGGQGGSAASGATATPTTVSQCVGDTATTGTASQAGTVNTFSVGGSGGISPGFGNGSAGKDGWMVVTWVN